MLKAIFRACALCVALVALYLSGARLAADLRETEAAQAQAPANGRFIETAEGRVFVLEFGPEDGAPLLFLHGTGAWSGLWRETLEAMAAEGYRAIAMDLTPFGFSDRAADRDYSRTRQADRILALAGSLERQPILIAHSFGAAPGSEAALRRPEAFAGLVLVAGAIGLEAEAPATLPLPLRSEAARRWIGAATALNPWLTGTLLKPMLHRTEAATPERIDILQRPMTLDGTTEAFADWLPSLLTADPNAISTTPEAWTANPLPLALIWGREDRLTPPAQAERIAEITGAPILWLGDVGHIPQVEAPQDFQQHLKTALSTLR